MLNLHIRRLESQDIEPMAAAFTAIGWNKPAEQFRRYLAEQEAGDRITLVAFVDDVFAGYLNVVWHPGYPPFREENIPEIQDFNVLPSFRRRGIGTGLMDEAERIAGERSPVVGIGFGLYADYGAAQRLYVLRGYVPDGRGITYNDVFVPPGASFPADDGLNLHLTKTLRSQ